MTISIIIPVLNGSKFIRKCLDGVFSSEYRDYECIIVDDGSTDGTQDIVRSYDIALKQLVDGPYGPAYARNQGAELATGDILFFVDADVVIKADTLSRIANSFENHPSYSAVFGSYDESPNEGGFISQYKNLFHHYVHQQANEEGGTFWSGCGAIRREIFLAMGGFDYERFPKPSIEDIDLGIRLREKGYKIRLDKSIQVKHLKKWTLTNLIRTDVLDRAIPWTSLILQSKKMPNDLNLKMPQRFSAGLTVLLLGILGLISYFERSIQIPIILSLFFLLIGHWYILGEGNFLQMSRKTQVLVYILLVLGITSSISENNLLIAGLLVSLTVFTLFSLYFSGKFIRLKNIVFASLIFVFFLVYYLSIRNSPILLGLSSYLFLILIVFMNISLYRFLLTNRGLFFSMAVLPFHLLYFFYSVAAFVIAGGMHMLKTTRA
jgi:glycosyltransferase involved in cell wall biosynthesis